MKGAELAIVMAAVAVSAAWADSQPTVTEALARLPKTHPRIFVSGQIDFDRVNERAGTTPEMAQLKEIVLATAEICCATPPVRGKDGMRMTGQDQFSESALTLAMAWRLTGDRRFAEALREQMLAVCEWPDWNPSHYLDTAEVLLGLSVGYDWCHDILTDAERVTIRTAMIKKGWETRYVNDGWQKAANNWPQVCWGMIGLTAVAIGAEEPDVAARMVGEILESMDPCLSVYAPHGAYPEGPGYWGYGTGYFLYMVAAFDSAFDTNFGLFDKPGISETGSFVDAMTAPSGDYWNFSDCGLERKVRVCDAYLAKKTGDRGILAFDIGFLRKFLTGYANRDIREKVRDVRQYVEGCLPLWLLWGDFGAVDETNAGALDYLSGGQNPVAVMRSSRAANAAYLGLKGGKSCANHGHMDQGSILWESDGYRWAMDIGPQNYTDLEAAGVDLWNAGQDSSRWKVYCLNNLSHNLVTVDGKLFSVTGFCDFVSTSFDGATASATLDLTPAVHPYATRGARRCSLDRATRTGTVEDGLKGLAPGSEVRWAIVTPAPYARVRGNDIILENFAGDCLTLRCESPASVKWQVVDMGFQLNPWDYRHEDLTLVSFTEKVSADGMFKSRVKFIPGEPGDGILAAEDVSLQALTSAEASRVDRTYELQSSAGISAKIAEAEAAGVKSVVLTGNLRRLTTANVRRLRSAGVKVYLDARDRAEAMRYAALFGADGVCIGSEAGLEQDVPKVGARTVRFFFFKDTTEETEMKSILFTLGAAGVWSAMTVCGAQEILLTKSGGDITKPDSWGGNPLVPGYDYVVPSGYNLDMTQSSWSGTYRFPGDHLVFRNNTASFWWENCGDTRWLDVNLVVESGAPRLWPNNAGVMINLLGTVQINAGAVLRVSTSEESGNRRGFCIRSAMKGKGTLLAHLRRYEVYNKAVSTTSKECRLEGDNSEFEGRIVSAGCGDLYIVSENSLGRSPASFAEKQLTLHGTHLCVTNDVTLSSLTRGIYISNESSVNVTEFGLSTPLAVACPGGGFDVAAGKTLTIVSPLKADGPVTKYGAGTLALTMSLKDISSSLAVSNGCLMLGGTDQILSVPLTIGAGATLATAEGASFASDVAIVNGGTFKLGGGTVSVPELVMAKGSKFAADLSGCDTETPRLTVANGLTVVGHCVAIDVVGGTSGTTYALMRAPGDVLSRAVRHGRIFISSPWKGTLAVSDGGDGTETLFLTAQDQDKVYYAIEDDHSFISYAVWKKDPTDASETPVSASEGNVYVAGETFGGKRFGVYSTEKGTFPGDRLILVGKPYYNKVNPYNSLVTIPDFTMVGTCSMGFSNPGRMLVGGKLMILPDASDAAAVALNCNGKNAHRPMELYSELSGCGTMALQGNMPPLNEYNLYGLYGDNTNYVGQIQVSGQTNFYCRIEKEENLGGNPETFTPDILRFNGGGLSVANSVTLDDTNRGIFLDGTGGIATTNDDDGGYKSKTSTEAERTYHGGATFNTTKADVTLTVNCPISGTGGVYVRAYGTVALGGCNTQSGETVVQSGTLRADSAKALGTGTLSVWADGTLAVSVNDETMPYGLELEGLPSFADGAKVTLSGLEAKRAAKKDFVAPLFLMPANETIDLSSIPFTSPLSGGWKWTISSRTVTVGDVDRQLVEVGFVRQGFVLVLQ